MKFHSFGLSEWFSIKMILCGIVTKNDIEKQGAFR